MIQEFSVNEYPFALAKMILVKATAMVGGNLKKNRSDGLLIGFSIGLFTPVNYQMNGQTKEIFGFKDFRPSVEFFWSCE